MDPIRKILIISSDSNLKEVLGFCFDGWGYEVHMMSLPVRLPTRLDVETIKKAACDIIIIDIESAGKDQLEICRLLKDDFATSFIPVITLINKRQLRNQLLTVKHGVDDYLIKPPDPLDLRIRIEMATRRSHHSVYASSLTGLPGGKILDDVLSEKIKKDETFSFAYLDIDNFKSFNDVYGYQRGDRVLLHFAYMLFMSLRSRGSSDDFISHIGGDDFAFITKINNHEDVCRHFIHCFDKIIPFHYSAGDRQKGFVIARDRSRKIKKIPLMSVSISVVNRRPHDSISSAIILNERIVEIKRYLKNLDGSKFMADRRESFTPDKQNAQIHRRLQPNKHYLPLGQILLREEMLSFDQLDEALKTHWTRGVMLGELLIELGFISALQLKKALESQGGDTWATDTKSIKRNQEA